MNFIIQKHVTERLHYDFYIQIGDMWAAWTFAKGPTLDPSIKRLAVQMVDHDLDYREFEGVLTEGSSAGKIMLWDTGTYLTEIEVEKGKLERVEGEEAALKVMQEGLEKGMLKFTLLGTKVKGSFAFVKTKGFGPKNSWLLIKHKDSFVQEGYDAADYDFSASSGKTMKEIT